MRKGPLAREPPDNFQENGITSIGAEGTRFLNSRSGSLGFPAEQKNEPEVMGQQGAEVARVVEVGEVGLPGSPRDSRSR